MHPVVKHIAARRNKKIPVKDGRKIALVLFGGLMTGVRGGGAVIALEELGLTHAFDYVYCISAGFANASYFLSENSKVGTSIYYQNLIGPKFIKKSRIWKIVNTEYVKEVFTKIQPLDLQKLYRNKTKVFVGVTNVTKNKLDTLDLKKLGKKNYFKVLEAAISIPFFHPGTTKINKQQYKDYGWTIEANQHFIEGILKTDATDILVVYNNKDQFTVPSLFSNRIYEIVLPKSQDMNHFEQDKRKLVREKNRMYFKVKDLFAKA